MKPASIDCLDSQQVCFETTSSASTVVAVDVTSAVGCAVGIILCFLQKLGLRQCCRDPSGR